MYNCLAELLVGMKHNFECSNNVKRGDCNSGKSPMSLNAYKKCLRYSFHLKNQGIFLHTSF